MDRALTWYYAASANGNAMAQFSLGDLYARGTDVVTDTNAALRHWEEAAQQDHPCAQMSIALVYVNGDTGFRDFEQGIYWCRRAAKSGSSMIAGIDASTGTLVAA